MTAAAGEGVADGRREGVEVVEALLLGSGVDEGLLPGDGVTEGTCTGRPRDQSMVLISLFAPW
jgi:hypothetical protein